LAYREDNGTQEVWETLREYYNANKLVEVWQVDASREKNGKYKVDYFQGYFTSFEISAPSDDKVELTINFAINGNGAKGEDTLTADQLATVKSAQYEYQKMAASNV
ncbi:phage major tail protein, TP901-1 family, partial [Streptococcus danieliae]|nr:phage major tail protein, TP901-1 family [Streptococcus danieliae]